MALMVFIASNSSRKIGRDMAGMENQMRLPHLEEQVRFVPLLG